MAISEPLTKEEIIRLYKELWDKAPSYSYKDDVKFHKEYEDFYNKLKLKFDKLCQPKRT